jgi:branched-chain amino acid transport system ATP-binding protein
LELREVSRHFRGLTALDSVSLEIFPGEIRGIIGPNGAGKTTLFNVIAGSLRPSKGAVWFDGHNITRASTPARAAFGLVRTFQLTSAFDEMTVRENLFVASHLRRRAEGSGLRLRGRQTNSGFSATVEAAAELVGVHEHLDEVSSALPYGAKKRLSIAMALAAKPRLLLLDEPLSGLNQTDIDALNDLIRRLRDDGMTIGIIEHNVAEVMSLCDTVTVLNFGKKLAEGAPREVQRNPEVVEAYLGIDAPGETES